MTDEAIQQWHDGQEARERASRPAVPLRMTVEDETRWARRFISTVTFVLGLSIGILVGLGLGFHLARP